MVIIQICRAFCCLLKTHKPTNKYFWLEEKEGPERARQEALVRGKRPDCDPGPLWVAASPDCKAHQEEVAPSMPHANGQDHCEARPALMPLALPRLPKGDL